MRLTGLKPYHYHVETLNSHPRLLNIGGKAEGQLLLTGDFTNYSETAGPGKVVGEMAIFRQLSFRAVNLSKIDQSSTRSGNYTCAHLIKS